ncbi:hypothetical protein [Brevibacillus porteri]|uniref:hypothetical protein n=1 Tax=Brevibacillus porteri TaxID=2126350 RepID=UPI003D244B1D
MNRQAVLDILNSLEVVETNGGEDAYILVENSEEIRKKLNAVGVADEVINRYGDDEAFDVLALAYAEGYTDYYEKGQFVLWGPIDDELRYRVLSGEGTATDAELDLTDGGTQKFFDSWRLNGSEVATHWRPLHNIADAWQVFEKMKEEWPDLSISKDGDNWAVMW